MKKLLPILIIVFLLFPAVVQAGFFDIVGGILTYVVCLITGLFCPDPCLQLISQTGGTAAYGLCKLVDRIASALYIIGWSLALVVLLVGGITIMTSGGIEDKLNKGKKIITSGLIGTAIVLCSGFILSLLVQFLAPLFLYQ